MIFYGEDPRWKLIEYLMIKHPPMQSLSKGSHQDHLKPLLSIHLINAAYKRNEVVLYKLWVESQIMYNVQYVI